MAETYWRGAGDCGDRGVSVVVRCNRGVEADMKILKRSREKFKKIKYII